MWQLPQLHVSRGGQVTWLAAEAIFDAIICLFHIIHIWFREAFDAIMDHSRAEDIMNLVVIESKQG